MSARSANGFRARHGGAVQPAAARDGDRLGTNDRKTVAALFALRFGWAASVAIAPYLTHACVPDISLDNVSLKFRDDTLYERSALHRPVATMLRDDHTAAHPLIESVADRAALRRVLRRACSSRRVRWCARCTSGRVFRSRVGGGMIISSWASHFIAGCDRLEGQAKRSRPRKSSVPEPTTWTDAA